MSKRILVVDDSEVFRKILRVYLGNQGYEVLECQNGKAALETLSAEKVNLIICDVNMPVMDGLTFVTEVKKRDEHKFTPIIMLTTESQEEKKRKGMEAGVKAWLVKPFSPEELGNAISRILV